MGDDIVIYDDIVAKRYMKIMDRLGVELSPAKSHVSKDSYEFAKRWFRRGIEVTGLPVKGLVEQLRNPFIVYTILYDFFKVKGNVYLFGGSILSLVVRLYKGVLYNGIRPWNTRRMEPRLRSFS